MPQKTIAQALRERKDIKGKIADWNKRLQAAVFYFTEDEPAFQLDQITKARNELVQKLNGLETSIALANAATTVTWRGTQISLALAVRTMSEMKATKSELDKLSVRNKSSGIEVKDNIEWNDEMSKHITIKKERPWNCALPTAALAAKVEKLQQDIVDLNDALETVNHKTLIVEVVGLTDASM